MVFRVLRTNNVKKKISHVFKKKCEKASDCKVRFFAEFWSIVVELLFKILA